MSFAVSRNATPMDGLIRVLAFYALCGLLAWLFLALISGCGLTNSGAKASGGSSWGANANHNSFMDADGNQSSSFVGVPPTIAKQDAQGTWINTPGPGGVITLNRETGDEYMWSPKDAVIASIKFTPQPDLGAPMWEITDLNLNISAPIAAYDAQVIAALDTLATVAPEQRMATIEAWKVAGTITEGLANALIKAFVPVPIP